MISRFLNGHPAISEVQVEDLAVIAEAFHAGDGIILQTWCPAVAWPHGSFPQRQDESIFVKDERHLASSSTCRFTNCPAFCSKRNNTPGFSASAKKAFTGPNNFPISSALHVGRYERSTRGS